MYRRKCFKDNERGAATTALLLIGIFAAVGILFIAILPLASGTEKSDRAQTAADAAALAGAKKMRDEIIESLAHASPPVSLAQLVDPQSGRGKAQELAMSNDAEITSYHAMPIAGSVSVNVRQLEEMPKTHKHAKAKATAELDLPLNSCQFGEDEVEPEDDDEASEDDDDEDDDEDSPPPEPEYEYSFSCPGLPNLNDYDDLDQLVADVQQLLEQRVDATLTH